MEFTPWTIVGLAAAFLTSFSFVPQVRKMWVRKSVADLSLAMMGQLFLGCLLWLIYGISRQDMVIIFANISAAVTLIIGFVMYFHYRAQR